MDFYMQCSLPEFDADQAAAACQTFCTAYAALAREASKKKQGKAWTMKPKIHMFQELAEYQAKELGNPADFWNYKDEDFMRLVSVISGRKGGPVHAASSAEAALTRYRILLASPGMQ